MKVKNLASAALALACRVVWGDWEEQYGIRPVLMETLVDTSRYRGTCYQAANWIHLGTTSGRGRQDRDHARHGTGAESDLCVSPDFPFSGSLVGRVRGEAHGMPDLWKPDRNRAERSRMEIHEELDQWLDEVLPEIFQGRRADLMEMSDLLPGPGRSLWANGCRS